MRDFVAKWRFSDLHKYSEAEAAHTQVPWAMLTLKDDGSLSAKQTAAIAGYSRDFCGKIRFGWTATREQAPQPPFIKVAAQNCVGISKRKTSDPAHPAMFRELLKGRCTNASVFLPETATVPAAGNSAAPASRLQGGAALFVLGGTLVAALLTRYHKPQAAKE
jgi:hypothetical protein